MVERENRNKRFYAVNIFATVGRLWKDVLHESEQECYFNVINKWGRYIDSTFVVDDRDSITEVVSSLM